MAKSQPLGEREKEKYGSFSLEDIKADCTRFAEKELVVSRSISRILREK